MPHIHSKGFQRGFESMRIHCSYTCRLFPAFCKRCSNAPAQTPVLRHSWQALGNGKVVSCCTQLCTCLVCWCILDVPTLPVSQRSARVI